MPEKKSYTATEVKAGAMVLASVVMLAVFVGAMRGCAAGGEEMNRFTTEFNTISGLDLGADVRFGGVKVGKVLDIEPAADDRSKIEVRFEVPVTVPVNHGSVATVSQVSLTTGKHLEISTGGGDEPLHRSGDHIASMTVDDGVLGIPDLSGVVARLERVLEDLVSLIGVERAQRAAEASGGEMVDLVTVAASLQEVMAAGSSTLRNLDAAVVDNRDEVGLIIERLADIEKAAGSLLDNLNAAVEENRGPVNATVVNVKELSDEAARRLNELAESLAVTLHYLQRVSGDAGHLTREHGPTVEQILLNLEATTQNLREFSEIIAEQPGALVRGTKAQGRPDGGTK